MYKRVKFDRATLKYGKYRLKADVANTTARRMIGLMYRNMIKSNECMLFEFGREGRYGIWMLNMNFPIDIIWLDKEMRVVDIAKNVMPCKGILGCKTYAPGAPAKYVVELKAGSAKRYKISKGSSFRIIG